MRIDGNYGLDPRNIRDNTPAAPGPADAANSAKPAPQAADAKAAEFIESCSSYIKAALGGDEIDAAAVEQARGLIASGQLDTPEAIRRAAEAILGQGI